MIEVVKIGTVIWLRFKTQDGERVMVKRSQICGVAESGDNCYINVGGSLHMVSASFDEVIKQL